MAREKRIKSPTQLELVEPVFSALVELGGSATVDEISEKVIAMLDLSDEVIDELHRGNASQQTELEYQLAWARTRLKNFGAITNSRRGVWVITPAFSDKKSISRADVTRQIKIAKDRKKAGYSDCSKDETQTHSASLPIENIPEELEPWKLQLAEILHAMDPFAFERLAQRLLRECGFAQVSVTKKTGDGGIDGTGKLRINGIFSFNVAFQCKRFKGSVSAGDIRDFRGSLTADIEKGVLITTGVFTKAARDEASKAGIQQIDLIDGEEFINKLIEYRIGIREKTIFEVDDEFFSEV